MLLKKGAIENGEKLIFMASSPFGKLRPTNTIRCEVVGDTTFHEAT